MSIRDIRKKTGLTQRAFAMSYRIPLQTLKQWESDSLSTSFRKPPAYVEYMLGRLVGYEFGQEEHTISDRVAYLRIAAADSKYDAKLWFRYLRKELEKGVRELTEHEVSALSEGNSLTMFQKISLRRALQTGTETNRYVMELNDRAKTTMMDQLVRKPKKKEDIIPPPDYIAGMKLYSAREQDVEDVAAVIGKLSLKSPDRLRKKLASYGLNRIDVSILLEAFGLAYGMQWLERYYVANEEKINRRIRESKE